MFMVWFMLFSNAPELGGMNTHIPNAVLGFETNDISLQYYHFNFLSNVKEPLPSNAQYEKDFTTLTHAWWNFVCGDESQFYEVKRIFDHYVEYCDINDNPQAFLLLLSGSYKLRMEAAMGKKFSVFRSYMKLIPCLKQILEKENECNEFYLISAIYHYGWGAHGNILSGFLSFSLPKADTEKGLEMLSEAVKSNNLFVKSEAMYFLYKLGTIEKGSENTRYLNDLIEMYPDNIVFRLEKMGIESVKEKFSQNTKNLIVNHTGLSEMQKNHLLEVWRSRNSG